MNGRESSPAAPIPEKAVLHRIRFVPAARTEQAAVMEFADPAPTKAVRLTDNQRSDSAGGVDILTLEGQPAEQPATLQVMMDWVMQTHRPGLTPPVIINIHATHVIFHGSRVAAMAAPERMDALLTALIEFSFYEAELAKLERAVADAWPTYEADVPLTFEVRARDMARADKVRRQLESVLNLRMRHARLVPRLSQPGMHLATLANQLGERLRERTRVEDRLEFLAGQLEVLERGYELAAQRFSEFRTSRSETTLEWIIIVLLAAEVVLLLIDVFLALER